MNNERSIKNEEMHICLEIAMVCVGHMVKGEVENPAEFITHSYIKLNMMKGSTELMRPCLNRQVRTLFKSNKKIVQKKVNLKSKSKTTGHIKTKCIRLLEKVY